MSTIKGNIKETPGYLPPDRRPRCRNCGKRLGPVAELDMRRETDAQGSFTTVLFRKRIMYYGYDRDQLFCKLACGYRYGIKAARHKA